MSLSREQRAAEILRRDFGFEVDLHPPDQAQPTLYCYDPTAPLALVGSPAEDEPALRPGLLPNAIVGRPRPGEGGWGVLAPGELQERIFLALNGQV